MASKQKTKMGSLHAYSLQGLVTKVNEYNTSCPDAPILKEDIVDIFKEEETFILLYYK